MNCPLCDARLVQVQRDGILLELCRSCKGAWLEHMELERVFSVFSGAATGTGYAARGSDNRDNIDEDLQYRESHRHSIRDNDEDDDEHDRGHPGQIGRKRKRGGFLDNIADMFGG